MVSILTKSITREIEEICQKNKEVFPFFCPVEANVQGMCLSDREARGESFTMSLKVVIYLCLDAAVGREAACNVTVQTCWLLLPIFCQYLP